MKTQSQRRVLTVAAAALAAGVFLSPAIAQTGSPGAGPTTQQPPSKTNPVNPPSSNPGMTSQPGTINPPGATGQGSSTNPSGTNPGAITPGTTNPGTMTPGSPGPSTGPYGQPGSMGSPGQGMTPAPATPGMDGSTAMGSLSDLGSEGVACTLDGQVFQASDVNIQRVTVGREIRVRVRATSGEGAGMNAVDLRASNPSTTGETRLNRGGARPSSVTMNGRRAAITDGTFQLQTVSAGANGRLVGAAQFTAAGATGQCRFDTALGARSSTRRAER